jgi:hypothetical protein
MATMPMLHSWPKRSRKRQGPLREPNTRERYRLHAGDGKTGGRGTVNDVLDPIEAVVELLDWRVERVGSRVDPVETRIDPP